MASGGISLKGLHAGKFTVKQAVSYIFQKVLAQSKETFEILVIGETGSGKSTLINNILGKEVAKVGETTHSETAGITCHEGIVQEVPVRIHDTPGLGDSRGDPQVEEVHLREIEEIMRRGKITVVIFCFKKFETRMSSGNIDTFKTYHRRLQLNWEKVIIALTFADVVPAFKPVKSPAEVYQSKLKQWKDHIGEVLREKVGVAVSDEDLRILPVTSKYATKLPNGEEWFTPLWLSVMEVLDPHQMFSYLKMHYSRIFCPGEAPSEEDYVIVTQLISEYSDTPPDEDESSDQQPFSDLQSSSDTQQSLAQQTSSSQQRSSDQHPSLAQQTSSSQQPSSDQHPSLAQQTSSQQPSSDQHPSLAQQTSSSQQPSSDQHPSSDQQPSSDQHPSLDQRTSSSQQPSSDVGIYDTIINLGPRNIQNVDCPQQADDRQQEYFQRFNAVLERGLRAVLQIPQEIFNGMGRAVTWAWDIFRRS